MSARRTFLIAGAGALLLFGWLFWWRSDERAIRRELANLAADANAPAGEGLGTLSWAGRLGTYFTDDVVIDAGQGRAPMVGRAPVIGLATRLQPLFAAATVSIDDVTIQMRPEGDAAAVQVTATFRSADGASERNGASRRKRRASEANVSEAPEGTAAQRRRRAPIEDAREFALEMKKDGRRWRIARATAVDILR